MTLSRTGSLVLTTFEKAHIFWFSQNRPPETKGPFVTTLHHADTVNPAGQGKSLESFFAAPVDNDHPLGYIYITVTRNREGLTP